MLSNAKGLWVIGLSTALMGGAFAQGQVTGVKLEKGADGVAILVQGSGLAKPTMTSSNGGKVVKLVFDANLKGKSGYTRIRQNGVRYITWGWLDNKPPKIHVNFILDQASTLKLTETNQGWAASFGSVAVAEKVQGPTKQVAQKYPDKVPPLDLTNPKWAEENSPLKTKETVAAVNTGEYAPTINLQEARVTLNFENTDVVQILKALALQANVNVVTSPDVAGKLTVALDRVSVSDALDLVTTLSGLKYAKIGRTFVVTTAAKFAETVRQISNKTEIASETRVVPIYSGEGTQIKAAVLKAVQTDTVSGQFEILLPSDKVSVQTTQASAKAESKGEGGATKGGEATGEGTILNTKTDEQSTAKDQYVVLIGTASRLQEVEAYVRAIDRQIASAMGVDYPSSNAVVRQTYYVKGGFASDLIDSLGVKANKLGNVEVAATPKASTSRQSIVITGREDDVKRILASLEQLDASDAVESSYMMYDVMYADPRALREELLVQVPGLRASIPPASAGNPKLYVPGDTKQKGTETVGEKGTGTQSTNPETKQAVQIKGDSGNFEGLGQPYSSLEDIAYPMRLVLRGTADQLSRAKELLKVIDVAPRQIALELRIMELTKTDAQRVGLDWNLLTGGTLQSIRINQGSGDTAATPGNISGTGNFAGGGSVNVLATLDSIANNRNMIARPNLFAMDGRETELFVGNVIRYIESIQATQNGTTVQVGEVPVGVRFAVMPRIGGDGKITMDIRPVVSSLTGFTPVPGGGNLPQTSVRIAQSSLSMNSGETIALGGLVQESDRKAVSGIPILKDIPIIGSFFRRTDTSKDRTEVVFFITAKVVNPDDRANAANPKKDGK